MHYKLMYPSEYLNAADLHGKDAKVKIERIEMQEVPDPRGGKKIKPVMYFEKAKKKWPLPKCCATLLAQRFGKDTDQWLGKTVTLYETTCSAFGQNDVECIRIREEK